MDKNLVNVSFYSDPKISILTLFSSSSYYSAYTDLPWILPLIISMN